MKYCPGCKSGCFTVEHPVKLPLLKQVALILCLGGLGCIRRTDFLCAKAG